MNKAAICTIGDEILIGQIVDTNSSAIAKELNLLGIQVSQMQSIADDHDKIIQSLDNLLKENDIVLITGGLGPTKDDITKQALADLFGSKGSYINKEQQEINKIRLTRRKIAMINTNFLQSEVPEGSEVIVNEIGTAPCILFRFKKEQYSHCPVLYSMPGVPHETKQLIPKVLDDIKSHYKLEHIYHKTMMTFGVPESLLAEQISEWENNLPKGMKLAYLPNQFLGIRLRLSVYGNKNLTLSDIDQQFEKVKTILGNNFYGYGNDTLPIAIGRILKKYHKTVATAESCTAGLISSLLTSVPGSSEYVMGGVVSYSNNIKTKILKVDPKIINEFGAVSRQCVEQMAKGVKNLMNTDYAVATSGISGPGGGSKEKPVGTIWMAVAYKDKVISKSLVFNSTRQINTQLFASWALDYLRRTIEENDE
ncbi:MAG: CinA family nicotinamide mononucleotide deamidase-related protein [Bacteroidales bacterium]